MSHALIPSFPILHSHMDSNPPCNFTYTLISFHLASFIVIPIPLLAQHTHFITPTLTTYYLHIPLSQFTHSFALIMPREIVTVQVGQCGNQSGNL